VKRAVELFTIEEGASRAPFVERTWWSRSEPEAAFISVAATHWEMCVTRLNGDAMLTVRGPETRATPTPIPADAEFFGIEFGAGTYMPRLPPGGLVDRSVTLPPARGGTFRLAGSSWKLPGRDDADAFVDRLVDAGLLIHDPIVASALAGKATGLSARTVERRVARATGLTQGAIGRIRRAEAAVALLSRGVPASETARRAGYADQPHLTRSLRRLVGQTPARIAASAGRDDPAAPVSLAFKTAPPTRD
jgi:AraC-like DNA-binding protein